MNAPRSQYALGLSASQSKARLAKPPVARIPIHTATLRTISPIDVAEASVGRRPPYAVLPLLVSLAPFLTHSTHWKPTAASRMHSGQIGWSQRWQRM